MPMVDDVCLLLAFTVFVPASAGTHAHIWTLVSSAVDYEWLTYHYWHACICGCLH